MTVSVYSCVTDIIIFMKAEVIEKGDHGYFHSFGVGEEIDISLEDFFSNPELITIEMLLNYLHEARKFLMSTPGPNLAKRQTFVPGWFNYWENLISNQLEFYRPKRYEYFPSSLVRFEELRKFVLRASFHRDVGVLFAAGFEGHAGHIKSVEQMVVNTCPCILLEPNSNFLLLNKNRYLPFLLLQARLKMWSLHPDVWFVSVVPEYPNNELPDNLNEYYQRAFDATGARRCFADELDPVGHIKIRRGAYRPDNLIDHIDVLATSTMVEKVIPRSPYFEFDESIITL